MQIQHNMHGHKLCPNKLLYPLQYFCIKQTVSLWTVVCCKEKSPQQFSVAHCEPLFCHILTLLLFPLGCHSSSAPPVLYHTPFPVSFLVSCLPSLLQSLSLSIPTTPSVSLSVSLASPSPSQSYSCGTDWARGSSPHQRLSVVECKQATEAPISHWLMSPLCPLPPPPSLPSHPRPPQPRHLFQWQAHIPPPPCPPPFFLYPTTSLQHFCICLLCCCLFPLLWLMHWASPCSLPFLYILTFFNPSSPLVPLYAMFPSPSALHQPQSFLRLSSKLRLVSVSPCLPPPKPPHWYLHSFSVSLWILTLIRTRTVTAHEENLHTGGKLATCHLNLCRLVNTHRHKGSISLTHTWVIYHSTFGSLLL